MRLFVNTQHPYYQTVARNGNEAKFWLGVPNDVDDQTVGDSLGRKPGEVFFTSENLLETRRKIQLMFDSWSNPNIFADGLIKPDRAQEILRGLIDTSQAERIRAQSFNRAVSQPFNELTSGNTVLGDIVGGAFGIVIGALAGITNLLGLDRRAAIRAADSLAPWLHTIQDFPNVNTNIRKDGNKRSPKTLYDDRSAGFLGAGTRDFNDDEAILCGYLETLADALYGKTDYHPDKRGMVASKTKLQQFFVGLTRKNDPTATYAHGLIYIAKYLQLIDDILRFDDESLSRAIDLTEATIVSSPISIRLDTVKIALVDTLESAAEQVIKEKVYTYLDPLREYKILLNAGEDRQYVMESWRKAPSNPEAMQFKLINPLDRSINVNDSVYVSREIAKTVIDTIDFKLGPEVDITPYLRPRNTNVGEYAQQKEVRDVTLKTLGLLTGSQGVTSSQTVTYEDTIFRRWYTADFNSSELNMDFTNYANFVQYGSAYMRLNSFVNKLEKIESLTQQIKGSTVLDRQYAQEKENIIRNFDPYEQYLFYETASAYSASVFYVDGGREYNATGSWPRSGSTLLSTTSSVAISWFTTQSAIAERFDEFNQNQLTKHLPSHIQEDIESSEFLTFIDMFGHVMDNLKEYIDQFPNIYSTEIDPYKELTMDQVYEVATAFGLDLPNVYSLSTLQQYFASIYGEQGSRSLVAETWKRFLHAMMFIYKSKGTKTSLNAVLSTYGIRTPMLQIKETSYPTDDNYISSEELTYGLKFTSAATSSIRIPFVSSSVNTSTMTLRFLPTVKQSSSLLSGDDKWVVNLIPHPSASKDKYGRIEIVSGSNKVKIASSSYFRLYDTDYTSLTLRSQSSDFTVLQSDGDQLLYEYSSSTNLPSAVWAATNFVYIGSSGSIKLNSNFEGIVDEVRLWGENTTKDNIIKQAYDPGGLYGNFYTSPHERLYVNLSFSQPLASITQSAYNETTLEFGATPINLNGDEQWSTGDSNDGNGWQGFQTRILTSNLTSTPANKVSVAFPSASVSGSTLYAAKISTREGRYWSDGSFNYIPMSPGARYKISGYAYASGSTYRGIVNSGLGTADYELGYRVLLYNEPSDPTETQEILLTSSIGTSGWRYFETYINIDSANKNYLSVVPFINGPWPYLLDSNGNPIYGEPVCTALEAGGGCPGFAWFTGLEIVQDIKLPSSPLYMPTNGFTTASYERLLRNIKQYIPTLGATTYSNNKIKVAPPPVFNSLFVDEATNTVTLDPRNSIKLITDKIYTAGLNVVSFGVSPTDYVNQDIIRNMGTVSINASLGNYRDLKDGKYDQLDKIFKYYLNNYYKKVDPNEFIDFYSNLAQAPAETAAWLIPARAKLLTGIVIESPLLSRKKLSLEREITVGGSNTKNLEFYSSGSMVDFGIYVGNTTINVTNQNIVLSTTPYYIDSASICKVELSDVTGSNNYYETTRSIDVGLAIVPPESRSYGYARYAYLDEVADKPLQPMYNVPPRSDLLDYGVTSYFHKQNGIYRFIVTTPYKEWFLAKLDISPYTAVDPAYSQITLVPTSSTAALPGRYSTTTGPKTISSLGTTTGLLNIANVFSLQAVYGPASGSLRIRLYANASLRDDPAEISRPYTTTPASGVVLYDAQLNGNPDVTPPLLINVDRSTIYYRLDNRTSSTLSTEVVLNYFAYEPIQSIPLGYLPRHYRFSRENVIALKRRNYLGCKAVTGERVSDPTGRFGFERPFFTTVADYESVDVFKRNLPPRTPTTPPAPTDRTPPQRGGPPAPTPSTGPSGRPRLTSLLGRIFNRNNGQR